MPPLIIVFYVFTLLYQYTSKNIHHNQYIYTNKLLFVNMKLQLTFPYHEIIQIFYLNYFRRKSEPDAADSKWNIWI